MARTLPNVSVTPQSLVLAPQSAPMLLTAFSTRLECDRSSCWEHRRLTACLGLWEAELSIYNYIVNYTAQHDELVEM